VKSDMTFYDLGHQTVNRATTCSNRSQEIRAVLFLLKCPLDRIYLPADSVYAIEQLLLVPDRVSHSLLASDIRGIQKNNDILYQGAVFVQWSLALWTYHNWPVSSRRCWDSEGDEEIRHYARPCPDNVCGPHSPGVWIKTNSDPAVQEAAKNSAELEMRLTERQAKAIEEAVPTARVVWIAGAHHVIFLSNEADVLREMRAFLKSLGKNWK
jgi:hypothetical protein